MSTSSAETPLPTPENWPVRLPAEAYLDKGKGKGKSWDVEVFDERIDAMEVEEDVVERLVGDELGLRDEDGEGHATRDGDYEHLCTLCKGW